MGNNILIYSFNSALILSILYGLYIILLRKEIYFGLNRVFLLTIMILSGIYPLFLDFFKDISSNLGGFVNEIKPITIYGEAVVDAHDAVSPGLFKILSIIYLSGTLFFFSMFLLRLFQIVALCLRHKIIHFNGFKAVLIKGKLTPFTFFNFLFLSEQEYQDGNPEEIIVHERVHKEQLHSLDNLLLEFLVILQWFNPLAWLLRHSLKLEHEYLADRRVLKEGFNRVEYQKLLFENSFGVKFSGLTNNFNYSLLKNRLKMMTKTNSNRLSAVKYWLALPLMFVAILLTTVSINVTAQGNDKVYESVDVMPEYPGGFDAVRKHVATNLIYPEVAQKAGQEAKIYVGFVVDKKGKVTDVQIKRTDAKNSENKEVVVVGYKEETIAVESKEAIKALEDEAVRVVSGLSDFTPGKKDGKKVNVQYTFPVKFALK